MASNPIAAVMRMFGAAFRRVLAQYGGGHHAWGLRKRRSAAESRARQLLVRMLSKTQREEFEAEGYFFVEVEGRGRFCILPIAAFNVLDVKSGDSYCAVPRGAVPICDLMLSQKLILENDPERFFAVANRRPEIDPAFVGEALRPSRVLQSRTQRIRPRVRCAELSMIPYQGGLSGPASPGW